ncbi:hypothetical protein Goshw_005161 [Gossypium schwendimanii]|uniref:Peptidase C1A papain C-terminal domain-containing protein n=1 Tax=Gossypium schwendimanii TaxID=34291 RepID=A0A7J9LTW1_GOSSC|nr:hypothetical protein [Gossypium schwendimanii]
MAEYGRVYKNDALEGNAIQNIQKQCGVYRVVQCRRKPNGYGRPQRLKSRKQTSFRYENVTSLPATIDWRKRGAVTPIKDQAQCGKQYVTVRAYVTGLDRKSPTTRQLISLSEQELVDCDKGVDQGCEDGEMEDEFEFRIRNHGIASEATYPYKGDDGTCNKSNEASHAATISGYEIVPANNEQALQKAVANQPVSVSIDAGGYAFQFYSRGIFTGECGTKLDHGITAVGYGPSVDCIDYWLIKNSWGTGWGEKGYIMMQRNIKAKGLCGIAMDSSYPTV